MEEKLSVILDPLFIRFLKESSYMLKSSVIFLLSILFYLFRKQIDNLISINN